MSTLSRRRVSLQSVVRRRRNVAIGRRAADAVRSVGRGVGGPERGSCPGPFRVCGELAGPGHLRLLLARRLQRDETRRIFQGSTKD